MTTRIAYAPEMPQEYVAAVSPLLDSYAWLIPTWCHTLTVGYMWEHEDGDDTWADCFAQPQYRRARLRVFAGFLERDAAERTRTIVHELLHITTAPLSRVVDDILQTARMSDDARKLANEMQREAEESVVEDLAAAFTAFADLKTAVARVGDMLVMKPEYQHHGSTGSDYVRFTAATHAAIVDELRKVSGDAA